ncbi:hypothetical protein DIPPA_22584 [Diplonema papillatum]|nr:hypothetical protein DIPPA_22584 [Diplonema papillatum]
MPAKKVKGKTLSLQEFHAQFDQSKSAERSGLNAQERSGMGTQLTPAPAREAWGNMPLRAQPNVSRGGGSSSRIPAAVPERVQPALSRDGISFDAAGQRAAHPSSNTERSGFNAQAPAERSGMGTQLTPEPAREGGDVPAAVSERVQPALSRDEISIDAAGQRAADPSSNTEWFRFNAQATTPAGRSGMGTQLAPEQAREGGGLPAAVPERVQPALSLDEIRFDAAGQRAADPSSNTEWFRFNAQATTPAGRSGMGTQWAPEQAREGGGDEPLRAQPNVSRGGGDSSSMIITAWPERVQPALSRDGIRFDAAGQRAADGSLSGVPSCTYSRFNAQAPAEGQPNASHGGGGGSSSTPATVPERVPPALSHDGIRFDAASQRVAYGPLSGVPSYTNSNTEWSGQAPAGRSGMGTPLTPGPARGGGSSIMLPAAAPERARPAPSRGEISFDAVRQRAADIVNDERSNNAAYIDVGLVTSLVCTSFDVKDITELGIKSPYHIYAIQDQGDRTSIVANLVTAYMAQSSVGSLWDLLVYVKRQFYDLYRRDDKKVPHTYNDIGIGPYYKNPHILHYFPGTMTATAPPKVEPTLMFEAFRTVFDVRRKGMLCVQNWESAIRRLVRATGDERDPCIFVNGKGIGLIVRTYTDRLKQYDNEVRALEAAHFEKLVQRRRKESLDASDTTLEEIDQKLRTAAEHAQTLFAHLYAEVAQLLERGIDPDKAAARIQQYVGSTCTKVQLLSVTTHSLTWYCQSQRELKQLLKQVAKLEEALATADSAQPLQQKEKQGRKNSGGEPATASKQSSSVVTLSDVLSAASDACLSEKTVIAKLCTLEEECCSGLGVAAFTDLQLGSFTAFLKDHKAELSDVAADDPRGELKRVLASLLTVEEQALQADASRPTPSDLMQEILKYLRERGTFITSWSILRDIEEVVPKRFGSDNVWCDVCGVSFVTFMLKNVSTFRQEGYNFISAPPASSGVARPCKGVITSFILSACAAANKNNPRGPAADDEESLFNSLGEVLGTDSFTEALRGQFHEETVDDFGYGTAKDLLRQADRVLKANQGTFVFPELACAEAGSTARMEEAETQDILGKDPLETINAACREPLGANGVELASQLLWPQVYESKHGALDAFLSENIEALQQMNARVLLSAEGCKARPKCYLVNTFADISSMEAAAECRDYFKLGVQLWSLIYSKAKGPDSLSRKEVDAITSTLTDAFNAAHEDRLLPLAAAEMLVSIPASAVKPVFEDFVAPVLRSVEQQWVLVASKTVQKHPQKDALLVRACLLGYTQWVRDATKSLQESPEYPKKYELSSSSRHERGRATALRNVGKEKEHAPVTEEEPSCVPALTKKQKEQPAQDGKEDGDQTGDAASSPEMQLLQEIRQDLNCGEDDKLTRMLRKTLDVLSTQLYESRFHFFFELIQNADDNSYIGNTRPSLCITLTDVGLEVLNNEVGFTPANVRAVCGVNMSTKTAREAIGRKGIGFKAVFSVSDCPHIVSNGFNFYFDKESCDIGLILPIPGSPVSPSIGALVDAKRLLEGDEEGAGVALKDNEWVTRLWLPFRDDLRVNDRFHSECSKEIGEIESLVLLFLNQLKRITVVDRVRDLTRTLLREDKHSQETEEETEGVGEEGTREVSLIRIENDIELSRDTYFVTKSKFHFPDSLSHYKGALPPSGLTAVQTGFLKADTLPRDAFPVMGYLPTGTRLFKFILQADWNLNAARDRIVESDEWNNWLKKVAVDHLVESLDLLKAHIGAGSLPRDYVLAILPERQLDRTAWFRSFVKDLFVALKDKLCIPTGTGDFIAPTAAVTVPGDLREVVLELFPDDVLNSLKSKRYADASVARHEGVAVALGVTELAPGLWVDLMERYITTNAVDLSLSWLAKYFLTYDSLLQRSCLTEQQQTSLYARLSKLPILPVIGGKRLRAEGSSILYMPKTSQSSSDGVTYQFFDRLKIVDQLFFEQVAENTKLYIILGKLGVHPAHATDVLQSMFQHVLKEWGGSDSKNRATTATRKDADVLASCLLWLTDQNRRFLADEATAVLLEEVHRMLPLVCQVSQGFATADLTADRNVVPIEGSSNKFLAQPRKVHVMLNDLDSYRVNRKSLGWLIVDDSYRRSTKNAKLLQSTLENSLHVRQKLFGDYLQTNHIEPGDSWLTLQAAEQEQQSQFCRDFDAQTAAPKSLYKVLPVAQDGKYTLLSDVRLLGVERMVNYLSGVSVTTENREDLVRISELVVQELAEQDTLEKLHTRISYLPQFEGELFAGRVATQHDTRHSDGHPGTTLVMLREKAWLIGTDGLLHRPRDIFADSESVHQIFDHTVVKAYVQRDYSRKLALFGLVQEPEDHDIIRAVRTWQAAGPLTTTPILMVGILKRLRSNMKRLWVPDRRGMVPSDQRQLGNWHLPEDCFVKGGKEAFLDEALLPNRLGLGYTYWSCGHELGACGVMEHAPWELQVKCMDALPNKNSAPEKIHDLLKQFDLYQAKVPPEAFEALKKAKIWLTRNSQYVCPADSDVLWADCPVTAAIRKLPGKYELLQHSYSEDFMLACGIQKFSEVAQQSRMVNPWDRPSVVHLSLKCLWQIVFDFLQKAACDVLGEEELAAAVARATELEPLSAVKDCEFVEDLKISLSINGKELQKTGSSGDAGVSIDPSTNRMYIAMGTRDVSSVVDTVETWITEHLLRLNNTAFNCTAKEATQPLRDLCETTFGWRSWLAGIRMELTRHGAKMRGFSEEPWLTSVEKLTTEDVTVDYEVPPRVSVTGKGEVYGWAAWIVAKQSLRAIVSSCLDGGAFWSEALEAFVDKIEGEDALVAVAGKFELHFSLRGAEIGSGDVTSVCIREKEQPDTVEASPGVELLFEVPSVPADTCSLAAGMVHEVIDYLVSLAREQEVEVAPECLGCLLEGATDAATRIQSLEEEFAPSFSTLSDAFVSISTFAARAISDDCLQTIDVIPQRYKDPYEQQQRDLQRKKEAAKAARQARNADGAGAPSGPIVVWGGKQVAAAAAAGGAGNSDVLAAATAAKMVWASNEAPPPQQQQPSAASPHGGVHGSNGHGTNSSGPPANGGSSVKDESFIEAPFTGNRVGYEYGEGGSGKGYYSKTASSGKDMQLVNNPEALAELLAGNQAFVQGRVARGDDFIETGFDGPCDGYTFKTGETGTGYYKDHAQVEENDTACRSASSRTQHEEDADASDEEEEKVESMPLAAPEPTSDSMAKANTVVNGSRYSPIVHNVPQRILASLKTKFPAPTQQKNFVPRQTNSLLFSETGKQGEYAAAEFLRQQKDRFPTGVIWTNEQTESFLPFDLVAGVSDDVFEELRNNRVSYKDVMERHPDFVAIEVKSTVHNTDSTSMYLSLSELKAAEVLREKYILILVSIVTGKIQEYADPYELIQKNYLSLLLLPPTAGE